MEVVMKRSPVANKESSNEVSGGGDSEERFVKPSPTRTADHRPSSNSRDSSTISQEDQIESTKAEMGEAKEENQRLKTLLSNIVKDYRSLQMHFFDIVKQENPKEPIEKLTPIPHEAEETDLVFLRLGTNSVTGHKKLEEKINKSTKSKENGQIEEGLTLGLDCKFEGYNNRNNNEYKEPPSNPSADDSFEEPKEEEAGEPWMPSKMLKNLRSGDDEVLQQTHVKKARVSVRVRCETPTMNDGCQWRKYGQKIAKGNPCPRAYYRCTVAPTCPVRKQVQRCAEDMSILITTYEGNHNHPLPMSATSMSLTTSAAASMLMTGSSTSHSGFSVGAQPVPPAFPSSTPTITGVNSALHNLNFSLSENSRTTPFYVPNTTISPSPSYSTITLDLTAPLSSTTQTPQFNKFSSSSSFSISMPSSWSSRGHMSCAGHGQSYKPNYSQNAFYQSYMQKSMAPVNQNPLTDSIAKVITSDPSFQSALQAAITSYVGPAASGCVSSLFSSSVPSSSTFQRGNLAVLQSPLMAMSSSKSTASAPPVDISWEKMK